MTDCWACGAPGATVEPLGRLRLHRCPACGLRFRGDLRPGDARAGYADDRYFAGSHRALVEDATARSREARRRVRVVRAAAPPPARLLEAGAGGGFFLAEAVAAGYRCEGLEPSPATARLAAARSGGAVSATFLEDAELPSAAFDVAVAWHVVEHLVEPRIGIARLRDALRPGGVLAVEVPNAASRAALAQGDAWPALEPDVHVAHFGPASLRALLERAGFDVRSVRSVNSATLLSARQLLWPGMLLTLARQAADLRAWPLRPHPEGHDLLRAVALRR